MCDHSSIQVALRVRPLVLKEIERGCREVLDVYEDVRQVRIKGSDKAFSYNHVFSPQSTQKDVCTKCVTPLIDSLFTGYNVTILAYGQTGSGKTHSMGTNYDGDGEMGVIPTAVDDIFVRVRDSFSHDFTFNVSFTELYQETLYDLLSDKPRNQCALDIREDSKGIVIQGITEFPVKTAEEVFKLLVLGSSRRATAATNMNAHSSRSHAIFTINMTTQNKNDLNDRKMAKFNLVDLAGSERSKKTGAEGVTFKEGVNINRGLLILGNVISALGDEKQAQGYISYRDSNLTRLLKDSLGGNSITLMIACVSPADYNLEETLSTLRYADRARKIKNKPIVNQDPKAAEIIELKKTIQQLKLEIIGQGGTSGCNCEKTISELNVKNRDLRTQLSSCITANMGYLEKLQILQTANESLTKKFYQLKNEYDITLNNISIGVDENNTTTVKENLEKLQNIKKQFLDIDTEQKKTENEIRDHELMVHAQICEPSSENILNAEQVNFTSKQITLQSELEKITKELVLKEELAQQITSNMHQLIDYSMMNENEEKIATLEHEKEELMRLLKDAQNQPAAQNKVSRQRYKRVQELEHQIQDLKKKIQEQSRLIKLKEKDQLKVVKLNSEIQQMKSSKVQLIKKMREDYNNFKDFKMKREKELAKLRMEDRKKQNQIIKMEVMHTKQQNVLRRKVEEAAAINKRLQNTLNARKQAQEMRFNGRMDKVEQWLKQEMDLYVDLKKAETCLAGLIEGRATLQRQLKEMLETNPGCEQSAEYKDKEEDIELRSVQIQQLQQKLLDSDDKTKIAWEKLQTMGEAKAALKTIWANLGESSKNVAALETKLNDLQAENSEICEKLKNLERHVKTMEEENNFKFSSIQKEYEEKIQLLLSKPKDEPKDRYNCLNLSVSSQDSSFKTPEPVPVNKTAKPTKLEQPTFVIDDEKENLDVSFEDDVNLDPDWKKTPLGKRIVREKVRPKASELFTLSVMKRTSGGGCGCTKPCSSRCGCRRSLKMCGSECKCPEGCQNKVNHNDISSTNESEDGSDNGSKEADYRENGSGEPCTSTEANKVRRLTTFDNKFWINKF